MTFRIIIGDVRMESKVLGTVTVELQDDSSGVFETVETASFKVNVNDTNWKTILKDKITKWVSEIKQRKTDEATLRSELELAIKEVTV